LQFCLGIFKSKILILQFKVNRVLILSSSLSPYSFDVSPSCIDVPQITHDSIPIGAIPILATSTSDYNETVSRTINAANTTYQGSYQISVAVQCPKLYDFRIFKV
jgi:hypothetical protein